MARYREVPDHMKITSEMIEPMMGSIMARLWMQATYMKDTQGIGSFAYADALENLWQAMEGMTGLSSLCIDTVHATILLSKRMVTMARIIEKEIGINPISNKNCMPFRHNTNISTEAINEDEARRELLKDAPVSAEQLELAAKSIAYMNSFNIE